MMYLCSTKLAASTGRFLFRRFNLNSITVLHHGENTFRACWENSACNQFWKCILRSYVTAVGHNDISDAAHRFRHQNESSYFITTPIFYVNAAPHIGHLYTAVLCDAVHRWYRLKGVQHTIFSTGTDEHGLKIQQAAASTGQEPGVFCDHICSKFQELFTQANISNTDFIRTTEARHRKAVETFWGFVSESIKYRLLKSGYRMIIASTMCPRFHCNLQCLVERGYIYKGRYTGWYSLSDEAFLSEKDVTEVTNSQGHKIMVSTLSGHPVEWMHEDNYMFRLSEFGPQLTRWLDKKVIQPDVFEPMVRALLRDGLQDLSVSRQRDRLQWGIPVPSDTSQTIYVWLDALVNYLTVAGYPESLNLWPCDCHVVGKDILRFHAVYWPAFLMAVGLEPPRQILVHSHWMVNKQKMSKSLGNVVDPFERMESFGTDGLRYFLLKDSVPHSDGNYSDEQVVDYINSDLVNTMGNLLSRITSATVNPEQVFPEFLPHIFGTNFSTEDQEMFTGMTRLVDRVAVQYESFHIYKALDDIMSYLHWANELVQRHEPWELCKQPDQSEHLSCLIHIGMETLRICAILLQPVIPVTSGRVLSRLRISEAERTINDVMHHVMMDKALNLGPSTGVLYGRLKYR